MSENVNPKAQGNKFLCKNGPKRRTLRFGILGHLIVGHSRSLFLLFTSFHYSFLYSGFEPRISGVGGDCSTDWATVTALTFNSKSKYVCSEKQEPIEYKLKHNDWMLQVTWWALLTNQSALNQSTVNNIVWKFYDIYSSRKN